MEVFPLWSIPKKKTKVAVPIHHAKIAALCSSEHESFGVELTRSVDCGSDTGHSFLDVRIELVTSVETKHYGGQREAEAVEGQDKQTDGQSGTGTTERKKEKKKIWGISRRPEMYILYRCVLGGEVTSSSRLKANRGRKTRVGPPRGSPVVKTPSDKVYVRGMSLGICRTMGAARFPQGLVCGGACGTEVSGQSVRCARDRVVQMLSGADRGPRAISSSGSGRPVPPTGAYKACIRVVTTQAAGATVCGKRVRYRYSDQHTFQIIPLVLGGAATIRLTVLTLTIRPLTVPLSLKGKHFSASKWLVSRPHAHSARKTILKCAAGGLSRFPCRFMKMRVYFLIGLVVKKQNNLIAVGGPQRSGVSCSLSVSADLEFSRLPIAPTTIAANTLSRAVI
ncbi:hypothetical protein AAG570_002754 [Ranatra chinensis]|uniref:Uncharacterized protein n=1 Tax=Ranatra chinensis TaxID=642074 RepID=A0ABD0YRJ0_9HEMI